jgi:hypothetical protein
MLSINSSPNSKPIGITAAGKVLYLSDDITLKKNEVKMVNLQVLPALGNQRQIVYVAGASGSGKSVFCSSYIKQYQVLHPDNEIYIFSQVTDDPSLRDIEDAHYIPIDETLISEPIDILEECSDSLILFDDVDNINDKHLYNAISNIIGQILEMGRHRNITCLITSHLINGNDKKKTRTILNESHIIVIFPKSTSAHSVTYFLKNYLGITGKEDVYKILHIPSRWIALHKNYPQYALYTSGCWIL